MSIKSLKKCLSQVAGQWHWKVVYYGDSKEQKFLFFISHSIPLGKRIVRVKF